MDWDEHAKTWDEGASQRAYAQHAHQSLTALAARLGAPLDDLRICDFGCGTGLLTELLVERAASIDCVDRSEAMLAKLRSKVERSGWSGVQLFNTIPEGDQTWDLVVCSSVCAFLKDYPGTVARLVSRLRPGGLFVQWDWELDPEAEHPMGLTREAIQTCLHGVGLEGVVVDTAFSVTIEEWTMSPLIGAGRQPGAR